MEPKNTKRCPDFAAILKTAPPSTTLHAKVVECFASDLERLAKARCRNEVLAEDAVQDALLVMLQELPGYRGEAPLWVWLTRLVRSACARLKRGRKNDPAFNLPMDTNLALEVTAGGFAQEASVLIRERIDIIHGVLAQVDEPNRTLLLLHEGQDVPLSELAEQFDLSQDAIKARLKRTRAWVRQRLLQAAEEWV